MDNDFKLKGIQIESQNQSFRKGRRAQSTQKQYVTKTEVEPCHKKLTKFLIENLDHIIAHDVMQNIQRHKPAKLQ